MVSPDQDYLLLRLTPTLTLTLTQTVTQTFELTKCVAWNSNTVSPYMKYFLNLPIFFIPMSKYMKKLCFRSCSEMKKYAPDRAFHALSNIPTRFLCFSQVPSLPGSLTSATCCSLYCVYLPRAVWHRTPRTSTYLEQLPIPLAIA